MGEFFYNIQMKHTYLIQKIQNSLNILTIFNGKSGITGNFVIKHDI